MIKRRVDRLQKQRALDRDFHRCINCGSATGLQMHHVYFHATDDQRYTDSRNNAENCVILCMHCHLWGVHKGNVEIDQRCREYLNEINEHFLPTD